MDVSKSSLNPYASAYIPLARRGKGNEGRPNEMKPGKFVDGRTTLIKHSEAHKKLTDQSPDEETEMDLAYLAMSFPGVSDQSISGVYYANGCDVDASIHMLKQLEVILLMQNGNYIVYCGRGFSITKFEYNYVSVVTIMILLINIRR